MISSGLIAVLPLLLAAFTGVADATACNATSPCPAFAPCCSEFGFCGTDDFCLGGCNPYTSKSLDSCRPEPMCQDATYTFSDQSRILTNSTFFDGNSTKYDWVVDKGNIINDKGDLAMLLTQTNGGTRLSSTKYVHYGKITANLKTGRWGGVVTAFITMSDIKDEIDWEFPGAKTTEAQSNLFWQGVVPTTTTDGKTHDVSSDTFSNFHDYTIDWEPDTLTFSIDNQVVRTVKKSDTINATGVASFPTTPSRVQLSIWPAGIDGVSKGTVDWAGGMINWDDPDYKSAGQFYAIVHSVSINCTGTQTVAANSNITSYVYSGNRLDTNPTILYSNRSTLLNAASGRFGTPVVGSLGGMLLALGLGAVLSVNALLL
ncbi:hypothetical protein CVT25_001594 [Psilocybe cyanescens]|uniref:GH16 domain-containing protein n=1 Tax=Psilocybe cyanescens TaxID=93625 RepID=A0A409WPZ8_PSICY|nr:hypothetical protein CVT25_001594 [Psilocybe cyanescens]